MQPKNYVFFHLTSRNKPRRQCYAMLTRELCRKYFHATDFDGLLEKKKNYRVVVVAGGGRSRMAYVSLLLNGNLELGFQA